MVGRQVARDDRHQPDQQQRAEADERQHLLRAGRARRALMLQQEGHEQEPGGDERDRIDPQRQPGFDGAQIEQREMPRIDRRIRREQAGQDVTGGASPVPSARTGDQASQLHQTDTGATNLLYLIQAAAPYTEAPPDSSGYRPAISA